MKPCLIIAEAGVNHNGDMDKARELVRLAAEAGADLVKFQTFDTAKSISRSAAKAEYQIAATGDGETQYEMVKRLELSIDDHHMLKAECEKHGIGFFSTAFDPESLQLLLDLGVDRIKVPSGEVTNLPLLRHYAAAQLPVILSTGMANLDEIGDALAVFEDAGLSRADITVLHCNTEYPTPFSDVNLRAMSQIADTYGVAIGYSDHTPGIEVPIAAVALGATVIEKHFTLDRTLPGPDHLASLEPDELAAMCSGIRNIEQALAGDGRKTPSPSELPNRDIARKSIVASGIIAEGEQFSESNLGTKRPGTGISPMRWDEVIGKTAKRDFAEDEAIEL
ncbi:N-acetylneuraminate synthase [Pseudoblastomonas halimionae]|uniref:N-acetylneuraminate synthase n=1 Tax=Alteriqipengyuania halimionae TaxID=1926630 RepID=A0A6I4U5A0_9SPHN|nr:N-acetylneuraminate synthase [Alteriqipengyuania halimionae]MXP10916.1 N-acetylneuraminate synthase [Alteriqipengyuania halimionae]